MMKYVSNHHPPHCWIESPKVLNHIHMPYCEDFMSKPILVNEVSPLDTIEKMEVGPDRAAFGRRSRQVEVEEGYK